MTREDHIGFEIKTISNLIKRRIDTQNEEANLPELTRSQIWVIRYIYEEGQNGDVYQRDIEKAFNIRRSTATGILQLMEKKGLIERHHVPHDARMKKIVLTDYATQINDKIHKNVFEMEDVIRKGLSDDEVVFFKKICSKIIKNLE